MKRIYGLMALIGAVGAGVLIQRTRHQGFALPPAEKRSLRDAPADTGDWPGTDELNDRLKKIRSDAAALREKAAAPATAPAAPGACDPSKTRGTPQNLDGPIPATDGASRLNGRGFPSVFEAWNPAQNLDLAPFGGVTALPQAGNAAIALHDVAFFSDWSLGLVPIGNCAGLGAGFTTESISKGLASRAAVLSANPNAVLLKAVVYFDADASYLPEDSEWWLRSGGTRSSNSAANPKKPHPYYHLDYHNREFREHVARQCKAAVQSGVYDGCFFDWWSEDADRVNLLQEVRRQIGDGPLIIVNVNNRLPTASAPYINGMYMEGFNGWFWRADGAGWDTALKNLQWAAHNLRAPALTLLEGWFTRSRSDFADVQMMRALTALSLTQSNGAVLFGDPDNVAEHDHLHDWYPFWDKGLGRPSGEAELQADGGWKREFQGGTVVYNPAANKMITVSFAENRISRATHKTGRAHDIAPGDGDIYLKP